MGEIWTEEERDRVRESERLIRDPGPMSLSEIAAALGKKVDRYSPLKVGDAVRVVDQESDQTGWIGTVTAFYLGNAFPVECRMSDDPELEYRFAPEQLMIVQSPLAAQKAVDPSHEKTVINENGGKQSRLEYAVGSADVFAILAMAKVQAEGDAKYGRDNWRLIPEDVHIEHALTHLILHRAGDTEEAHLAHALTRVHMAMAKHIRPDYYGEMESK